MTEYGRGLNDLWHHFARSATQVSPAQVGATSTWCWTAAASEVFVYARKHGYKVGPGACESCDAIAGEKHKAKCRGVVLNHD